MTDHSPSRILRQFTAGAAAVFVAVAGLFVWYELKVGSLKSWLELSFFFMPLAIGAGVGAVVRWCREEGTFGLAGFAVLVTAVASLAGIAMQHRIDVEKRLRTLAGVTYSETHEYARDAIAKAETEDLRGWLTTNKCAVISRLATSQSLEPRRNFWLRRSCIHLHWVATRQIVIYGQSGTDKTIWEATQILDHGPFLDDVINGMAREPVSDSDVNHFRETELPLLNRMVTGQISRHGFEGAAISWARSNLDWMSMPIRGFGPASGFALLFGMMLAYKLIREADEEEIV